MLDDTPCIILDCFCWVKSSAEAASGDLTAAADNASAEPSSPDSASAVHAETETRGEKIKFSTNSKVK